MADVIKLARELGAALQADARYEALMQARKVNDEDEVLQNLIGEFNMIMLKAQQEAEKEDKDEAKMQEYNEQYVAAYQKIMANENKAEERELTLEESFSRLDALVEKMENRDIPLEESFQIYKEGMDLLKKCSEKIDLVEKKMQQINADGQLEDFIP